MSTTTTDERSYEMGTTTGTIHFHPVALAGAASVVAAAVMLVLGAFGAVGVYEGAVEAMQQWHLFFEPTVVGTAAGIVEAAVVTFVLVYAFAWLYNTFAG
jgi:hypothetical protein